MYRASFIVTSAAIVALVCGCATPPHLQRAGAQPDEEVIEVSLQHPKMAKAELRNLQRLAAKGDGKAAFELYGYYLLSVEGDERLAKKYFFKAVELEYPGALYLQAFSDWSTERFPDIDRVERTLRRAIELGFQDEQHLLDEVLEVKRSGVIPTRSRFRLFPEKSEPNKPLHGTPAKAPSSSTEPEGRRP